jgi:uncharacterized lipoprotein YddW (UPF0748 family)
MNTKSFPFKALIIAVSFSLSWSCGTNSKSIGQSDQEEFRAVWLHAGLFDKDEDIAKAQITKLFDSYKEIGINNLFCYYTAKEENNFEWDYLQTLIDVGHVRDIKIHVNFCPGHNITLTGEIGDHPEWLIQDRDGQRFNALNLANPEARQYWMRKMSNALAYDIDGIHLDYIRFPVNQRFSYDSLTLASFKSEFGMSPLEDSQDDGSMLWCEWINWNAAQITGFVKETRELIQKTGKKVLLGADVFPNPETAKILIGQDWESWSHSGLIDFICPMFYTNNLDLFREYTARAVKIAGNGYKVYPGIGVHTSHNKITKELLVKEIEILREEGAEGLAIFSGNSFGAEMRDTLRLSVFKQIN